MPIFLDSHHGSELPIDVIRTFLRAARAGTSDGFGVMPLDLYCGDDGRMFCVVSAPDEAAIRQGHAAQGVVCRRIRRVSTHASGSNRLNSEEKSVVRQMIAAEDARTEWRITNSNGDFLRQVS